MRDLLDPDDGENRAVRAFLMAYGCQPSITAEQMAQHMRRSGFDVVPEWVAEAPGHLTKGGAQLWLRMLFALEPPPNPGSPEASAMIDAVLAEYDWPSNAKNAARAGYVAATRLMGGAQAKAEPLDVRTFRAMQSLVEGILTRGEANFMARRLSECVGIMAENGWQTPTPWPTLEPIAVTFAAATKEASK